MSRRKRKGTPVVEIKTELDELSQDVKKKRKLNSHYDPVVMCQELYDIIRNHKSDDGRVLCESFVRVPKRRTEPTYYEIVTNPIDLLKIQHKIKSEEYEDVDLFAADIQLMFDNARAYYKPGSQEVEDADRLWQLLVTSKDRLLTEAYGLTDVEVKSNGGVSSSSDIMSTDNGSNANVQSVKMEEVTNEKESENDADVLELFAALATASDGNRSITDIFKVLPSRKRYPEYYEIIKEPIDLRTIAQKLQSKVITTVDDLVKAFTLMVQNAKTFNEPGSQIYKDAVMLKRLIGSKRQELAQNPQSNNSEVVANVCMTMANLPSADDENVSSSESDEEDAKDENPLWILYNSVRQYKDNTGYRLSEPFLKLPNKRQYPDYYQEIKQPMCLVKIRKKLEAGDYADIEELVTDFNLMFDNAQQYNIEDSKIFKDAVKLRNVMKGKRKEQTGKKVKEEVEVRTATRVRLNSSGNTSGVKLDNAINNTSDDSSTRRRLTVSNKKSTSEDNLKKRLMKLYRTITQYEVDGRRLSLAFSELPSAKEYPDYYQVIPEPIDLKEIEHRIKTDKYDGEEALIADLELMLKNARCYNEESSQIYADAEELEKVLRNITKDWALSDAKGSKTRLKLKALNPLQSKLQELYNTVRDFADNRGRLLALPFAKLPAKNEYPDYYEVIKKPIDMQRISQRISQSQYENLEELTNDFVLMFDNACKYNEPESLIYKDALTLQRVCLEKKQELINADDSSGIPDVRAAVQEILVKLFVSTFNHTDEEGRCLSDSFLELPSFVVEKTNAGTEQPQRRLTFEQIKRNLDKGRYRRLDTFQDNMLEVFNYARKVSRSDSQLYEDAVELIQVFVRHRDELCKRGEVLLSPALNFSIEDLQKEIDSERKEKIAHEMEEKKSEADLKSLDNNKQVLFSGDEKTVEWQGQTYAVGDFVYVQPRDVSLEPHIVCVEQIKRDLSNCPFIYGTWFLRPAETYHLATRKFLTKEVFRSDYSDGVEINKVLGKCFVMFVKDYFHLQPVGFRDDDVFVCESRYTAKTKQSKKIKIWQVPDSSVKLVAREQALTCMRCSLSTRDKSADRTNEDDVEESVIERKRENLRADGGDNTKADRMYYEQYLTATCGWLKTGDFVYKKALEDRPIIMRVDRLWIESRSGEGYVSGPVFMYPHQVDHQPTRLFYKNELFKSDTDNQAKLSELAGRCSVLALKDYCSSRLTEIREEDVYICESKYVSDERLIRRIVKPVKKHSLSLVVCDDEVYFFKKPLVAAKEPSPLLLRASSNDVQEDSNMSSDRILTGTPVGDVVGHEMIGEHITDTITKDKKKGMAKFKSLSGYILFSGECRKEIQAANPDMSFGDISRLVGLKWRTLGKEDKDRYEARVKKILEEQAANEEAQKQAAAQAGFPLDTGYMYPPPPIPPIAPIPMGVMPFFQPDQSSSNVGAPAAAPPSTAPPIQPTLSAPPVARPPSPIFVSVPPRTQRLLHSETYMRYIEGLTPQNQSVSNWRRIVQPAPVHYPRDPASLRLPTHWLGNSATHHNSAVDALWALRDLMLKDTLNIVKYNDL